MNLGTWRIAIIVALVVVGVAVLANGFDPSDTAIATPSASTSPDPDATAEPDETDATPTISVTPEPEETPAPNESGVLVQVFNGTDATGLAGVVQEELEAAGHTAPEEPGNAPSTPVAKTTVYYRGGDDAEQNRSDATFIAETFLEPVIGKMPKVAELSGEYDELVGESITVVVLIGEDYAANFESA